MSPRLLAMALAPFLGLFIIALGNGFLSSLTTLRLGSAGESATMIGIVSSAYFIGLTLGAIFNDVFPDMTTDDVLATGFLNEQIEEMRRLVLPPEEQVVELEGELGSMPEFGRSITLSIEFEDVKRRDMTKALLKRLAEERRRKPGAIVQEALAAWSATNPGKKRAGRGKAA